MRIEIENTEDQLELIKAIASKDPQVAYEAKAAVADIVAPVISKVINTAPTVSNFYRTVGFGEDENPSMPLDLLHNITGEDYIRVHSQTVAGGLSSNELFPPSDELKFKTYSLDSAWSVDKKFARKGRLDVISAIFTRMAQEFLLKQEKTATNQLLGALVAADTNVGAGVAAGNHVISAGTANQLQIDDFNNLITLSKRMFSSYSSGTPTTGTRVGITDLVMSPEMTEEIRGMAYQPVNTRSGAVDTSGASSIPATEQMRNEIMDSAGLAQIFGIGIVEILEMGVNQRYNKIFDAVNTAAGSPVTFTQANDEIVLGIDRSNPDALIRPAITEEGLSTEVSMTPDDQFVDRQKKTGWYGQIEEGRVITEDRVLTGLVV
jgi:hypothetical protein